MTLRIVPHTTLKQLIILEHYVYSIDLSFFFGYDILTFTVKETTKALQSLILCDSEGFSFGQKVVAFFGLI